MTFRAGRSVDFVTRLGWLFNLLNSRAVASRANDFRDDSRWFLHDPRYLKLRKNLMQLQVSQGKRWRNGTRSLT
jgi:hypothetical protein